VPQDYDASSAMPCLFIHSIYVIHCLYIRSLSVILIRISFHVLYGRLFKTLYFLNYDLMICHDYDITSSLRRGALHQKRLDIALGPRYEVGKSSSAAAARPAGGFRADYGFVATVDREIMYDPKREVGYGITDSWDEIVETLQGAPVSTDTELGGYVREFATRVRQDTYKIYIRLDDEQTERQLLAGQMSEIRKLQAADRRRQTVISELLRIDHRRSKEISESRTALQGQGLAGDHTQPGLPEEAGGSA
nr:hypothetical protein [Tanacetum cinerariifolium]